MSPAQAEVDGEVQDGGTTRGQWRQPGETDVDPFILLIVATFHGHVQVFSRVRLCDSVDCSPPGSSVHETFQPELWNGLPFPLPGDLPDAGRMCFLHCRQILYY